MKRFMQAQKERGKIAEKMRHTLKVKRKMMKASLKVSNPTNKIYHMTQKRNVNMLKKLGKAMLKETGDKLVRKPLPQLGVTRSSSSLLLKLRPRQLYPQVKADLLEVTMR